MKPLSSWQSFSVPMSRWLATTLLGGILTLVVFLGIPTPSAQATSVYAIPKVSAGSNTWVVDKAEVLSRLTLNALQEQLSDLAQQTGIELRLVTFRRLDYGDTPQSFTDKLFTAWFPDATTQAQEALFTLDVQTNYGGLHLGDKAAQFVNEETLTSLLDETLAVPLRDGNRYNQALEDVTARLGTLLKGEPDPGPPVMNANYQVERTFATPDETKGSNATLIVIVLLVIATVVPMLTYFAYVR
jgi:uncharacterized protein